MEKAWHKHWPEGVPKTIEYPDIPLHEFLTSTAAKYSERTAMIFMGGKTTYRQLDDYSSRFAAALKAMGVEKGDKVALFLPNVPQFIIAFFGALKAGATVTPINPLYKEREAEFQLNDSGAETIVSLDLLFGVIDGIRNKTKIKNAILTSVKDFLPTLKRIIGPLLRKDLRKKTFPNTHDFMDLIQTHRPTPPEVEVDPQKDIAVLQYTGGTTGVPKGAMLTHYNLVVNAIQTSMWLPMREGQETVIAALPFFHIYGMTTSMNAPLYSGATMILFPRFEMEDILKSIGEYKATVFCGVPTMYVALINYPELAKYNLRTLRGSLSGAAALPLAVMNKFNEITGGNLVEGYGLTEASPVTHCNPLDSRDKVRSGSIGVPFPDTDSKIVDLETGTKDLKSDEIGELVVRGPQVMVGYWNNPEETKIALREGWLYTGDIAKYDEDGYFYIVDRKKDMIDAAGFKVWPREVEEVLYEHPAVKEAAVIGITDPYRGETVKAFVVLKEEEEGKVAKEGIINFCKERIAAYKVPRLVEFRKELPKTLVGKILRRALKEEEEKAESEGT